MVATDDMVNWRRWYGEPLTAVRVHMATSSGGVGAYRGLQECGASLWGPDGLAAVQGVPGQQAAEVVAGVVRGRGHAHVAEPAAAATVVRAVRGPQRGGRQGVGDAGALRTAKGPLSALFITPMSHHRLHLERVGRMHTEGTMTPMQPSILGGGNTVLLKGQSAFWKGTSGLGDAATTPSQTEPSPDGISIRVDSH